MSFALPLFYVLAFVAVAAALALVTGLARSLVASLACLVATMLSLAGIFLQLGAWWIAAVQVLLHVGGVAALFWIAIVRLRLETGFTTRNLTEGAIKTFAGGGVLAIAIAFSISVYRDFPVETATYEPTGWASVGLASVAFIAVALALLVLTAIVAFALLAARRPE